MIKFHLLAILPLSIEGISELITPAGTEAFKDCGQATIKVKTHFKKMYPF